MKERIAYSMAKQEQEHAEQKVEEIVDELDLLKKQISEFENKYKRALADYQNLEKRVGEQRRELIQSANKQLLLTLLPVLDTLHMASQHSEDQGLQLTIRQFIDTLKDEGVTKIETIGKQFDPYTMEAVATGEGDEGKVIEELRAGYMLFDKVLRAAQVKVGKKE